MAIPRGYEFTAAPTRHPRVTLSPDPGTLTALIVAAGVAMAVATRSWIVVIGTCVPAAIVARRIGPAVLLVGLAGVGVARSDAAWRALEPDVLGPYTGRATVATDPQPFGPAARIVLEIDGQRHEMWVRGRARRLRVETWQAGDVVTVAGERRPLDAGRRSRVAWQHVVGTFEPDWLGDVDAGGQFSTASNRVRGVIRRGLGSLPAERAALARGLMIGDDRDQPAALVERMRASGLAHLSAVSGQNVALVVAAASPLLRRARPLARWAVTLALIGWFVVLTRAEPSVLRAGAMAALGATAFALGRQREPLRLLAVAVVGLLLVDPLLAWSVGFWLSVGATVGVTGVGPPLARRLHRLGPLAMPVAVTLGAQVGVAIPSIVVFGRLPLVGLVANLLAVPVAGLVMLYGLPACLVAGLIPALAGPLVAPVGWGAWWVDAVATVGAAAEPDPPWSWVGWGLIGAVLAVLLARSRRPMRD